MGRTSRFKKEPPLAFKTLRPEDKKKIERRQIANGFTDVDGLQTAMNAARKKIGKPAVSRSIAGLANKRLKEVYERIDMYAATIKKAGGETNSTAIAGSLFGHDLVTGFLLQVIDDDTLSLTDKANLVHKLSQTSINFTRSLEGLKEGARIDEKEFYEATQATANEVSTLVKNEGLSDDVASTIAAKILGIGRGKT